MSLLKSLELFGLRPLLRFDSISQSISNNNKLFNIENSDHFQILSWTAGGRFDGREFIVIACRSSPPSKSRKKYNKSKLRHSNATQQYLIVRSINTLPQKSKRKRKSKNNPNRNNDNNNNSNNNNNTNDKISPKNNDEISHLYGDTYHIDDDDVKSDEDLKEPLSLNSNDYIEISETESEESYDDNYYTNRSNNNSRSSFTGIKETKKSDDEMEIESISTVEDDDNSPTFNFKGTNFTQNTNNDISNNNSNLFNPNEEYEEFPTLRIISWFKTY